MFSLRRDRITGRRVKRIALLWIFTLVVTNYSPTIGIDLNKTIKEVKKGVEEALKSDKKDKAAKKKTSGSKRTRWDGSASSYPFSLPGPVVGDSVIFETQFTECTENEVPSVLKRLKGEMYVGNLADSRTLQVFENSIFTLPLPVSLSDAYSFEFTFSLSSEKDFTVLPRLLCCVVPDDDSILYSADIWSDARSFMFLGSSVELRGAFGEEENNLKSPFYLQTKGLSEVKFTVTCDGQFVRLFKNDVQNLVGYASEYALDQHDNILYVNIDGSPATKKNPVFLKGVRIARYSHAQKAQLSENNDGCLGVPESSNAIEHQNASASLLYFNGFDDDCLGGCPSDSALQFGGHVCIVNLDGEKLAWLSSDLQVQFPVSLPQSCTVELDITLDDENANYSQSRQKIYVQLIDNVERSAPQVGIVFEVGYRTSFSSVGQTTSFLEAVLVPGEKARLRLVTDGEKTQLYLNETLCVNSVKTSLAGLRQLKIYASWYQPGAVLVDNIRVQEL